MNENEIGAIVVDCAIKVHMRLGPGLLESVYETVLAYELERRGLKASSGRCLFLSFTMTLDSKRVSEPT